MVMHSTRWGGKTKQLGRDARSRRGRMSPRSIGRSRVSELRGCRDLPGDPRSADLQGSHRGLNQGSTRSRVALVRYAIEKLLHRSKAAPGVPRGPLCVVTPTATSSLLADLADRARAEGLPCLATDGQQLGRDMDAATKGDRWDRLRSRFCRRQLVIVQRFEEIGGPARQAAFRQLFDAADAADWCLGLSSHPHAGRLEDDLAARLAAGLVVTIAGEATEPAEPVGAGPSIARIVSVTARHFGIATATLIGSGRSRTIARARSLAMLLARRLTNLSYEAIGRSIGGRDHTTAMHATRVTTARLAVDDGLAVDAEAIVAQLMAPRRRRGTDAGRGRARSSSARGSGAGRSRVGSVSEKWRDAERS
jgi:hypothetical protein